MAEQDNIDLTSKKVLITGGLGFIGSNLAHRCVELGAEVTIYDCLDPRSGGNMRNVEGLEDRIEIVLNDIRNFEGVSNAVLGKDILFSCAAFTSHPQSMKEPLVDIDVNCKGVVNILEAAKRFNPTVRLVHVGTSTQIGQMQFDPVTETHPEFPMDIYSANKAVSEKYVLIYGRVYGVPASVVRLVNVYGPRSNIRSADFGFMNYFVGLGLAGKTLSVYGSGEQLRTLLYVDDAVSALLLAATREEAVGDLFFAATDQQYTIKEIATTIGEVIGGDVSYVEWPSERAAIEIGDAVISNQKITDQLGWYPKTDLQGGLGKTKTYFEGRIDSYLG